MAAACSEGDAGFTGMQVSLIPRSTTICYHLVSSVLTQGFVCSAVAHHSFVCRCLSHFPRPPVAVSGAAWWTPTCHPLGTSPQAAMQAWIQSTVLHHTLPLSWSLSPAEECINPVLCEELPMSYLQPQQQVVEVECCRCFIHWQRGGGNCWSNSMSCWVSSCME